MAKSIKLKKREFKVDFFKVCEFANDNQVVYSMPMNIEYVLKQLEKIEIKDRIMNIEGERIRLQQIRKINNIDMVKYERLYNKENIWEINFIKFKDSEIVGLADEYGSYNEDEIENFLISNKSSKKYLASSTPCILDADKNIIIIPKNKEAVSSGVILEFFRRVCNKPDLDFAPVSINNKIDFSSNINIRSVEVSMKNIDIMNKYEDRNISENAKTVYEAISIFRKMGSSNMNIRGTMGNNKRNNLTKEIGMEILSLSRTDCKHIGVLKLGISKVEGDKVGNVEHIDLLGNKLCDKFYVKYSSDKLIKSSEILMKVIESYNNKYTYI